MAFDDEGQRAGETYLIRDGVLTGRLHSSMTAAVLGEKPTGNARALSFRYEPIVRMTTTTVAAGSSTREEVFSGVKDGYFVETVKHGGGMSTFTIAPSMSWRIRDGQIANPVRIAVMTGTVFETLEEIDAVSDTVSYGIADRRRVRKDGADASLGGPWRSVCARQADASRMSRQIVRAVRRSRSASPTPRSPVCARRSRKRPPCAC